jgi:hypothetical protein
VGATLYSLLPGQGPLTETDVGVVPARTRKGYFPPPRLVNASAAATVAAPGSGVCYTLPS